MSKIPLYSLSLAPGAVSDVDVQSSSKAVVEVPKVIVVINQVPKLVVVNRVVDQLLHLDLEPVQAQVWFFCISPNRYHSLPLKTIRRPWMTATHPPRFDLISCQLHDLNSVELLPSLTKLDLTANRLSSLDTRIATLSNLTNLSFRQNLFEDAVVEPISAWIALSGLEELVLRDNS
ncbi:hypothetical protein ACLB2K_051390 [Fragaria x ananassa]